MISTFDSVNHLLTTDDLVSAFRSVAEALAPGGFFVFDINTADAYAQWDKIAAIVDDDAALFVRGNYDSVSRLGTTMITMFRFDGEWKRSDARIVQRCYGDTEARAALACAGFSRVESMTAADAGMKGDIAIGRRFYLCRRCILMIV